MNQTRFLHRHAAVLVLVLALAPDAATAQTSVKAGWNLFSPEQDLEIGRQSAAQAEGQLALVRDPEVTAWVDRIGQRLAANAGGPGFRYQFRVVNAADVNAFALPGGFVYVNRGVLEQARNEGEVAGVLAHEIAHVALRHGTHQVSKAYAAEAGISILGGLPGGRAGESTATILNAVGGVGLNVLFLKYSRELEIQADLRGAQILAATTYSPQDMINFFHTMEKVDNSRKTTWLSDHPAPPDRINRIAEEARTLRVPESPPPARVAELQRIQSRMTTLAPAQAVQQAPQGTGVQDDPAARRPSSPGSVRVSVDAPSAKYDWAAAESDAYRVPYPTNWRVYQQGSTGLTVAPAGGIVNTRGHTDVVYGAVLNHYKPFNNIAANLRGADGSVTLEQATDDLIAQVRQGSPHLQIVPGSGRRVNVRGGQALAATLNGTNPNTGIMERVTVVTRQLGSDQLVYLLFVTPEQDAPRFSRVLQTMVGSMQVGR